MSLLLMLPVLAQVHHTSPDSRDGEADGDEGWMIIDEKRASGGAGKLPERKNKRAKRGFEQQTKQRAGSSYSLSLQSIVERISPSHSHSNLIITGIHAMRNVLDSSPSKKTAKLFHLLLVLPFFSSPSSLTHPFLPHGFCCHAQIREDGISSFFPPASLSTWSRSGDRNNACYQSRIRSIRNRMRFLTWELKDLSFSFPHKK